jgi:hypothetical protein
MPYLIDGHNLIPKISGLSLQALDDELQLVELLQEFCRLKAKQAEVFFDKARPGQKQVLKVGRVKAHFVARAALPMTPFGSGWRSWVQRSQLDRRSSDRMVQAAGRAARAQVVSAEDFAKQIEVALQGERSNSRNTGQDASLSPDEVESWLKLFRGKKDSP